MTDGAVLAHHVLVLEHHRALGAVLRMLIGSSGQVEDLVALDARRPREHRVRPDAGEVVDLEREHIAFAIHGEPRLHAVVAGVDVGGEGDRKSTRLNSSHGSSSYAVFCLKNKNKKAAASAAGNFHSGATGAKRILTPR